MTIGNHKTSVFKDSDGFTKVIYHSTYVVSFNNSLIILNSGGYKTNTTKKRMNETSETFQLGFSVFQKNFEWFVDFNGQNIPFRDNMSLQH